MPPKNEKTAEEIEDMYVEALQARRREEESLDNKTLDELDELEDDLEDDRILMEYRFDQHYSTNEEIVVKEMASQEEAITRDAGSSREKQIRRSNADIQT